MLCYTILYCTILYYTMLCYAMLYYSILYYTILCTCTEEKLGESAQEFSSNYQITYIGNITKQPLKELPESSQKTSKIPPKPPPKAPKNAPKIHLGTLPGTRPKKSSLIAL